MRALVTGGAGFVGGVVVQALLDRGDEVSVLDNLRSTTSDDVPKGATLVECSVGDEAGVAEVLRATRFDACFHFAGRIESGLSMEEPEDFFVANVAETLTLLRVLVAEGVERFVFSSSAAVYGDPQYTPIDEAHPTNAVSPYGESKLLVERTLAWLTRLQRLRFASLRYFNAAGAIEGRPERHRPESHLIPLALEAAAGERDALDLYGDDYETPDGTCIRDYVHVADLATAHVLAVDALDEHPSLVCNLGTGVGSSNAEVIEAVRRETGRKVPVRRAPRRGGDAVVLVAGNDLAHSALGWVPVRSSLAEIVRDAWAART
ncbi:MAG TPA: UDP-glucose 4-epimerase GalE [Acidimicrobiales bacterium]|nr:UDP-glucose 4-epimerase GalE [Acidimicrobiales bacterium]